MLIGALAIGVLSLWLETKKQEQQVCDWLEQRKSAKDSREMAAALIQVPFLFYFYFIFICFNCIFVGDVEV